MVDILKDSRSLCLKDHRSFYMDSVLKHFEESLCRLEQFHEVGLKATSLMYSSLSDEIALLASVKTHVT